MNKINTAWIIDDDKILTFILQKIMSSVNFSTNIEVFQNGEDAIQHLYSISQNSEALPDVILLDLNMPIMDGWQFLDEYKKIKLNKKIPIHIVSSSIDPHDHNKAKDYTVVTDFYTKPIGKKQLELIIESYNKPSILIQE